MQISGGERYCDFGQICLFCKNAGSLSQSVRLKVVTNEHQQLLLGEHDASLCNDVSLLQPSKRHIRAEGERTTGHAFNKLGGIAAEPRMLLSFVLQHRLTDQLLDVPAAEQGQLADDLPHSTATSQPHKCTAR